MNYRHIGRMAAILLAVGFSMAFMRNVVHAQGEPYLIEYPVPGSPLNVAVEAPGRIWYTLPEQGEIGLLLPTGDESTFETFAVGPGSEPYDLAIRRNVVWFTDRALNRIGAFNIAGESFTFYTIPTPDSEPTAIAVMPNGSVWFLQQATARLTLLDPTGNDGDGAFTEYPYGGNATELGDVAVAGNQTVWITATNRNEITAFSVSSGEFQVEQTSGPPGTPPVDNPFGLAVDRTGLPWMTILGSEDGASLIARYSPATTFRVRTTPTGSPDARPTQIAYFDAGTLWYLFYTEAAIGKVARLAVLPNGAIGGTVEASLGVDAEPWGAAVDADGQAWFAVRGNSTIAGWQPPYSDWGDTYLPLVTKGE